MKNLSLALILLALAVLLMGIVFVHAEKENGSGDDDDSENSGNGVSGDDSDDENDDDSNAEIEDEEETEKGKIKQKIKIHEDENEVETEIEIEDELEIKGNESGKMKIKFADGRERKLEIEPDLAYSIAYDILKANNMTLVLNGSNGSVTYEAVAFKNGKFLWLINNKVKIKARIGEDGNVTINKPWWSFLVVGEENDDTNSTKITICHYPPWNTDNKHTIIIGKPAWKAHQKHGDKLGPCDGEDDNETDDNDNGNETEDEDDDDQNETDDDSIQTIQNLTLEILSPEDHRSYLVKNISINISSNENVLFAIDSSANESYTVPTIREFDAGNHTLVAYSSGFNQSLTESVDFSVVEIAGNETGGENNTNSS